MLLQKGLQSQLQTFFSYFCMLLQKKTQKLKKFQKIVAK